MAKRSSSETDHYRKLEEEYDIEFVSPTEAVEAFEAYLKFTDFSHRPSVQHFMLIGEPGCGKSAIVHQVANRLGYYMLELRASHADEGIIIGYAVPDPEKENTVALSLVRQIREQFDEAKSLGKPVVVFFDELNRGKQNIINGTFGIIDNLIWGGYQLPKSVVFVAAINPATEQHNVLDIIKQEAALNRRYIKIGVEPTAKSLLEYAESSAEFHPIMKDYIRNNPKSIMEIDKMYQGKAYVCPAILEGVARRFTKLQAMNYEVTELQKIPGMSRLLMGSMGKSGAAALLEFIGNRAKNLTPIVILKEYDTVRQYVKRDDTKQKQEVDHAQVGIAAKKLADFLANECIDFSKTPVYAKNLARFMSDLSDELLRHFIDTLSTAAFPSNVDGAEYIEKMTAALQNHNEFSDAITRLYRSDRKISKSFESDNNKAF